MPSSFFNHCEANFWIFSSNLCHDFRDEHEGWWGRLVCSKPDPSVTPAASLWTIFLGAWMHNGRQHLGERVVWGPSWGWPHRCESLTCSSSAVWEQLTSSVEPWTCCRSISPPGNPDSIRARSFHSLLRKPALTYWCASIEVYTFFQQQYII